MSDQELLEMAARAIGGYYDEYTDCFSTDMVNWEQWEPLEDDGDAFRLAMNLDLNIIFDFLPTAFCAKRESYKVRIWAKGWHKEDFNEDSKTKAVRQVIVRAAAAMGSEI